MTMRQTLLGTETSEENYFPPLLLSPWVDSVFVPDTSFPLCLQKDKIVCHLANVFQSHIQCCYSGQQSNKNMLALSAPAPQFSLEATGVFCGLLIFLRCFSCEATKCNMIHKMNPPSGNIHPILLYSSDSSSMIRLHSVVYFCMVSMDSFSLFQRSSATEYNCTVYITVSSAEAKCILWIHMAALSEESILSIYP